MSKRFVCTARNLCGANYCRQYPTEAKVKECQARLPTDWNGRCAYQRGDFHYSPPPSETGHYEDETE